MNKLTQRTISRALSVVALLATATTTFAADTTTTFCGLSCSGGGFDDTTWNNDLNWTQLRPDGVKRAAIQAGYAVVIDVSTASADSLEVDAGASLTIEDGGRLKLRHLSTDPIWGDSVIDGALDIQKGGELWITDNNHAIKSDGGTITGLTTGGTATPLIGRDSAESCNKELRIYSSVSAGSPRVDSLVVHGLLDIQVKLVNDAYVVADNGDLKLSTCIKSGDDGFWVAENDDRLVVDSAVSGDGEWQLLHNASAVIQFNAACSGLTGKFDITLGTLDVNASVTTTGIVDFRSVNQSHPRIDVAFGAGIGFGQ